VHLQCGTALALCCFIASEDSDVSYYVYFDILVSYSKSGQGIIIVEVTKLGMAAKLDFL